MRVHRALPARCAILVDVIVDHHHVVGEVISEARCGEISERRPRKPGAGVRWLNCKVIGTSYRRAAVVSADPLHVRFDERRDDDFTCQRPATDVDSDLVALLDPGRQVEQGQSDAVFESR